MKTVAFYYGNRLLATYSSSIFHSFIPSFLHFFIFHFSFFHYLPSLPKVHHFLMIAKFVCKYLLN